VRTVKENDVKKSDLLCALLDVDPAREEVDFLVYGDPQRTIRTYRPGVTDGSIMRPLEDGSVKSPIGCSTVEEAEKALKDRSFPVFLTVGVAMELFGLPAAEFADEPWL
jgi:hypothetical protein